MARNSWANSDKEGAAAASSRCNSSCRNSIARTGWLSECVSE
jgi:hypothetical protein